MPCESSFSSRGKPIIVHWAGATAALRGGRGWDLAALSEKKQLQYINLLVKTSEKTCVNVAPSAKEKFVDSKCTNGFESYNLCSTVNQASLSKVLRSRREEDEEGACVKMEQLLQITFTNRPEGNSFFPDYSFSRCYWTVICPSTKERYRNTCETNLYILPDTCFLCSIQM